MTLTDILSKVPSIEQIKNRVDFNQNYKFDDEMIWKLVTYVRQFGFSQEIDRLDIGRQKLKDYEKSIGKGK